MIKVPANKSNPFGTPAYKRILHVGRNRKQVGPKRITKLTTASSSPGVLPMMPMSRKKKGSTVTSNDNCKRSTIVYRFVFDKLI